MEYEVLMNAISTVGFPIVIAAYLLIRFESVLKENTKILQELVIKIKLGSERNEQ